MELPAVGSGTVPTMISIISSIAICILMLSQNTLGFYLPGDAPQDFQKGDSLIVKVSKLTSVKTRLPYSYYSLRFCHPTTFESPESLGDVLHLQSSPYAFKMREPQTCIVVCRIMLDSQAAKDFEEKIEDGYRVNMMLDNLPLVVRTKHEAGATPVYQLGFDVGFKGHHNGSKEVRYFVHNHLSFTVKYHMDDRRSGSSRIVGFEVTPSSVKHDNKELWSSRLRTCDPHARRTINSSNWSQEAGRYWEITFTYDVSFQESEVAWSSRWDTYLALADDHIRWYSIANSLTIVLFLSGTVAAIMLRTLRRDISKYNDLGPGDEAREEIAGWKSLHADVFRPPIGSELLCIHVGTGVHLLGMTLATLVFAVLGFFRLLPSVRTGSMAVAMLMPLYASAGFFAGYAAARLHKALGGTEWRRFAVKTSVLFPGSAVLVLFALDGLVSGRNSLRAVAPLRTTLALAASWFLVSIPLVFLGSYVGYRRPAIEYPVKTGEIPRQIPERAWYASPVPTVLIGGVLPFSAVYVELFYILTSVWLNKHHYLLGLLFAVAVVLVVVSAEASVVLCYFQLCRGDYRWWWRSFLASGSSSLYLFLYAAFYYFFAGLGAAGPASSRGVYFGHALVASYGFFAVTGAVGFYACFWFTSLLVMQGNVAEPGRSH